MKKIIYILIFLCGVAVSAFSQVPQVNNIEKVSTWPGDTITITGDNFSSNAANLKVWFGAVEGTITSASETIIEVIVPDEADFEAISVVNLSTGLIGNSSKKFYSSFSGQQPFDPAKFTAPLQFNASAGEREFYDICACDFNLDGKPDIAATKENNATDMIVLENGSTKENLSFTLLYNGTVPNLDVGAPTLNTICGDLNGDGKPELIASRSGATRNNVFVMQNTSTTGDISFAPKITLVLEAGVIARRIKIADLNFDGKPEIIVTNSNANSLFIYRNTSTKTTVSFSPTPIKLTVTGADNSSGLEIQDLNGDRLPDIIVAQFFKDNLFILKNTSSLTTIEFDAPITLTATGNPLLNVKAGDLDQDGLPELVATNTSGSKILIFPNQSNAGINFGAPVPVTTGNGPWGIDMADMSGDGLLDVIIGDQNLQQINVLINATTSGSFSFTRHDIATDLNVRNLLANDFDGDGKPDIAFVTFQSGSSTGPFRVEIIRNMNCFIPEIRNEAGLAICPGQTKRINAVPNSAATFNWYKDGNPTPVKSGSESFLTITTSGDYVVEAISEGGSCVTSDSYTVASGAGTVPGDPVPSSNTPVCSEESIQLTVQDIAGAEYEWTGPNGFTSNDREPVITGATPDMAGVYSVSIKVGDCLSSEKSTTVEVVTLPVFTLTTTAGNVICEGSSKTLSVTSRANYSYEWFKDGVSVGASGTSFVANTSGVYSVEVTDNANSCSLVTNTYALEVLTVPVADFTVDETTACIEENITITNSSTVDPDATVSYNWTFGDSNSSGEEAPALSYATAGDYTLSLTVNYDGVTGCSDAASQVITITNATLPVITAADTDICPDQPLELSISGTFQEANWSTGESGNSITIDQPDTYSVTTLDANGCTGEDEIIIGSLPVPEVAASADKTVINAGEEVLLTATGADTYSWEPAALLDDPLTASPVGMPTSDTTFIVTGTLTDGCSDTAKVFISVNQGEGLPINPRKAFSPESTTNPTWEIDFNALTETCELAIYDERGRKILESTLDNTTSNGTKIFTWDATYNGNPLPEGVYYYMVGCPTIGNKGGTVLVVRN